MKTDALTPHELLRHPQLLVVPLYQRRYVWQEQAQWEPLWQDVLRMAEVRATQREVTHFLGACVLQRQDRGVGRLTAWEVVDGQQRLTTVQVAADAVAAIAQERGWDRLVRQLEKLTLNDADEISDAAHRLKFQHRNDDGAPFREVMLAAPPVDHGALTHAEARIAQAHRFFSERARDHLADAGEEQAERLVDALRDGLRLVVITLEADEDSQVIFETLNARGTPLTPADLIKNFVLHRVAEGGGDPEAVWREHWSRFEDPFWTQEVKAGRTRVQRSTLFLHQWLISRVGAEVLQSRLFPEFKHFVEHRTDTPVAQLIAEIAAVATRYRALVEETTSGAPDIDRVALAVHRFAVADTQVATPVLLWLLDPRHGIDAAVRERAVTHLESWVMRRMMLRATTADLGRVAANLITRLDAAGAPADEVVWEHLGGLTAASTYWPRDEELQRHLATAPVYTAFGRGRLQMLLEAVEDDERGFTTGRARSASRVARGRMHIEHLLPQTWRPHWPVEDPVQELERDEHVHRLGNLTLLTARLNSSVSNRAWTGERGKWAALEQHDDNLMTRRIRREHTEEWDEAAIDARTRAMVGAMLRTWPAPAANPAMDPAAAVAARVRSVFGVTLADMIATGYLEVGQTLYFREAGGDRTATLTADGRLEIDGMEFRELIDATRHYEPSATQSWWRWLTEDGRHLAPLRKACFEGLEGARG